MRYRPLAQQFFVLFVIASIGLGFCGANDPDALIFKFREDMLAVSFTDSAGAAQTQVYADYAQAKAFADATPGASIALHASGFKWLWLAQGLGAYYFLYFLVLLPLLGIIERPKQRPVSIADSVHKRKSGAPPREGVNPSPQPQPAE
jgi:ubiquinol-cytochrome c reductase cytochrome b subunit